jgi:two-component SAPR family response regulator
VAASPIIDVQCFGGLTVRCGDRELAPQYVEDGRVKATYAGWEVLAYLAAHDPAGVPTERLAEAVNPECREERAAGRLSVTLSRLRQTLRQQVPGLPGEVVRLDRDGRCHLDTAVVHSDVHAFLGLLQASNAGSGPERAAALERARALYQGDLLAGAGGRYFGWLYEHEAGDGVLLPDAYRHRYLQATRDLARLAADAGDLAQSVDLYRTILRLEPVAEDVVRELYRCYERQGDLGALLREEQRLRQALRDAWSDPDDEEDAHESDEDAAYWQPEQATIALFERIRSRLQTSRQPGSQGSAITR